jgi:NADH:ubiquinone oxidoreductase subunit 2 (subunit N)
MYALLVIGGLNTVLSVFYYVKVMKVMILDRSVEDVEGRPAVPLAEPVGVRAYALLLAVLLVVAGVLWDPLVTASDKGAGRFHRAVKPAAAQVAEKAEAHRD